MEKMKGMQAHLTQVLRLDADSISVVTVVKISKGAARVLSEAPESETVKFKL
jgi:hypothetical protein